MDRSAASQRTAAALRAIALAAALAAGMPAALAQVAGGSVVRDFIAAILGSTEAIWSAILTEAGADAYPEPRLVLFSAGADTPCGAATLAGGPFYCPVDETIYLDPEFFAVLEREYGAGGDFAAAYVIAHEVGHHVQNLAGILPRYQAAVGLLPRGDVNRLSVLMELQADCYAGIWGYYVRQAGVMEPGDLEEGLGVAWQLGDDTIQMRLFGRVDPSAIDHGTAELRTAWFRRGFDEGTLAACWNPDFGAAIGLTRLSGRRRVQRLRGLSA